jgi:hypothetical protein
MYMPVLPTCTCWYCLHGHGSVRFSVTTGDLRVLRSTLTSPDASSSRSATPFPSRPTPSSFKAWLVTFRVLLPVIWRRRKR